ncbi:hypothetical protein GJ654_18625 [Rhodoblastus acidophilus]|uniref:Uncharacterized protein n=1 Tax=Rhodoblastus acidophilus TaxID=1074 RepID=A0A6N8DRB6_RHOAC|nr:hypothetical protein [Rhodoblastus acidophilus]MCW2276342.1 hypothetical protein [Rhodoblastus acidophilus]MTV32999.1 hypothetical protein [Rhodoblastus acidophilus]
MIPDITWPEKLTPPLDDVLRLMNFQTGPIAHLYRRAGHDIPRKCEAEQAFVLHRFIGLAIKHGDEWRKYAQEELNAMMQAAEA